jgi:hypothetical protein
MTVGSIYWSKTLVCTVLPSYTYLHRPYTRAAKAAGSRWHKDNCLPDAETHPPDIPLAQSNNIFSNLLNYFFRYKIIAKIAQLYRSHSGHPYDLENAEPLTKSECHKNIFQQNIRFDWDLSTKIC